MQVTKITIGYQANYNGCTVVVNDEFDSYDVRKENPELEKQMEALQDVVIEKAYKSCIKRGRNEGMFNGDEEKLKQFAFKKAREMFGEECTLEFDMDESST